MENEMIKIVILGILACFLIYIILGMFNLHNPVVAGLTGLSKNKTKSHIPTGEAGGAEQYAKDLKTEVIKIQDSLLTSKYRNEYEDIILSLDDYMNVMMLKTLLNMDPSSDDMEKNKIQVETLGSLNSAKKALESTMKYLDST